MNTCLKGNIGEAKVMTQLIESGWEVFIPFSGHAPFDLIGVHPETSQLYRVSVKSCFKKNKDDAYGVRLSQVRMTVNGPKVSAFDNTSCDILACYLGGIDKICFVLSKDIDTKSILTFREKPPKTNIAGRLKLVDDFTSLP